MARRFRRPQRRPVFIGCEGESERSYVARLSQLLESVRQDIHLDAHLLRPGGGDPLALVQKAAAIVQRRERSTVRYADKLLLLDSDKIGLVPERDAQARSLAAQLGATIIWQETAHEALLLRHLPGCAARRPPSSAAALQLLVRHWPDYQKPMSANALSRYIDGDALARVSAVEAVLGEVLRQLRLVP